MCIINIENEKQQSVLPKKSYKPFPRQRRMVFFYLLKITTNVIIKAIAMIFIPTKPKNSRYIICNNTISIAPPRFPTDETVKFKGGNTLCFFLIFLY